MTEQRPRVFKAKINKIAIKMYNCVVNLCVIRQQAESLYLETPLKINNGDYTFNTTYL